MNFLTPKNLAETKGALDESALKKVSLCPNLGINSDTKRRRGKNREMPAIRNNRRWNFGVAGEDMITAAQLRAARGLLDWTRADLAKAAQISPETVKNIEHGTFKPQEGTAENIIRAFAEHNVEFTDHEGVRIRKDTITRYEGSEGFKKFMDDVYQVAQESSSASTGDKPICLSCIDDRLFSKYLGEEFFNQHIRRMNSLKNLKMRILIKEKPYTQLPEEKEKSYREYKWHPQQDIGDVPFYVYGNKLAIIIFNEEPAPHIMVISSAPVAKAYREQFDIIWQSAKPLGKP